MGIFKRVLGCFLASCFMLPTFSAVAAEGDENILKKLKYTVTTGVEIENSYGQHEENVEDKNYILTNGVFGDTTFSNKYTRWLRGQSRIVDFDLGEEFVLSSFEASFLHSKGAGLYIPRYVKIYVSLDGEEYRLWASPEMPFPMSDEGTKKGSFVHKDDRGISARYVKVVICTDINVYCDEIMLFGHAGSGSKCDGEVYSVDEGKIFEKYSDRIGGVGDIIKMYNGRFFYDGKDDVAVGDNTVEELIPYVAYIDKNGEIVDTMFDSFTFVPIHSDYPSGGRLTLTNGKPGAIMSDWLMYLDNTFKDEVNTDALDEAVGQVFSKLGKSGKLKVFFTIPYPAAQSKPFGDIDGDGVDEYSRTLDERVAITKWFADLTIERFNERNYENLEFAGFYWYREEVNQSNSDHEVELVKATSDYIHSKGMSFLFDPFYLSLGFDEYKSYGFDCAFMQPNYCFYDYFTELSLKEFAKTATRFGTGCEIEVVEPYKLLSSPETEGLKFQKYLYYGAKYGYMNTAHSYYQGAGPGTFYTMAKSTNAYLRSLYDDLYKFIKGAYEYKDLGLSVTEYDVTDGKITEKVTFDREVNRSKVSITIGKEPLHGTLKVSRNSSFSYTPNENYVGEDSFTLLIKDDVCEATETVITLNVLGSGDTENESEGITDESDVENKGNNKLGIIIGGVIGGLLAIGGAALMVLNKRKKKGSK
ncbi:MAG: DUF4855 domain-containing protein [Clostridia bacterium]|nr:DUF4855 domain-containing protein [Clostridia bacterium]